MVAHDYNPSAGEAERGWFVNLVESESFGYSESSYLKTKVSGPGGMTRSVRVLAAHAEDPNSVPSICRGSQESKTPVPGDSTPSSSFCRHCMHRVYLQTHRYDTHKIRKIRL